MKRTDQITHTRRQQGQRGVADRCREQHTGVAHAADRSENELPAETAQPVGEERHQRCRNEHLEICARERTANLMEVHIPQEDRQ